ncbi:hypothetical protein [Gordonia paraffinivorans]|uniref:hypothetical protein n=1 Tax=Gordonia paraffinivorans TaxID=175628 RepID=UPI001446ABBB|nr:hypothetical protein [Gordonia paraffinivorans]
MKGASKTFAENDYVGLQLRADNLSVAVVGGFTSDDALRFRRTTVERLDVGWPSHGYEADALDFVAEIAPRTLQPMVLGVMSYRSGGELRSVLDAWAGAAIRELAGRSTRTPAAPLSHADGSAGARGIAGVECLCGKVIQPAARGSQITTGILRSVHAA